MHIYMFGKWEHLLLTLDLSKVFPHGLKLLMLMLLFTKTAINAYMLVGRDSYYHYTHVQWSLS